MKHTHAFKVTIMLFMILFSHNLVAITNTDKDTTNSSFKHVDLRHDFVRVLMTSFSNKNFDSLIIFLDSRVEFYYVYKDEQYVSKIMTDYAALQELSDFLKTIRYGKFKIVAGLNGDNQDVIQAHLFFADSAYSELTTPDMIVSFVLNEKQSITDIAVQ